MMKRHSLSNKVRNSILAAILLQSVVFGIGLGVSGTFTSTVGRPYRVMESQTSEKNTLLSGNLNNALLITNNMGTEISRLSDEREIQNRLIDNLNHLSCASKIFYMDLDSREGYCFRDGEPAIYASGYGDITCSVGKLNSSYSIALSSQWQPKFQESSWQNGEMYWENQKTASQWLYKDGSLHYVITQTRDGHRRIMGLVVGAEILDSYMKLDDPPYKGMQMFLLTEDQVLYSADGRKTGLPYRMDQDRVVINDEGHSYAGVRSILQLYGHMESGAVYIAQVADQSELSALSKDTVMMIVAIYGISVLIAIVFSYIVIYQLMRPLRKLREDIAGQNPQGVHFEQCGLSEIDDIHLALNNMARRLEQSHSRYSLAMQAAGEMVGSFEYEGPGSRVKLSGSLKRLLDIPEEYTNGTNVVSYEDWIRLLAGMNKIEELEDGFWFEDSRYYLRAVSIRQQKEEHGVFCMVVDKTDAYMEIIRLRDLSQHDQLTGLYNAAYLRVKGQQLLDENPLRVNGLIFCDLDNLKYINDTYGHSTGDRYLQTMADLLRTMARGESAIPVRLSGDEFALFFYGYSSREEVEQKIRDGYEKRHAMTLPDGKEVQVNASIGLAFAQRESESMEELLKRADRAMYRIKRGEKNGIAVYGKSDEIE